MSAEEYPRLKIREFPFFWQKKLKWYKDGPFINYSQ